MITTEPYQPCIIKKEQSLKLMPPCRLLKNKKNQVNMHFLAYELSNTKWKPKNSILLRPMNQKCCTIIIKCFQPFVLCLLDA